MTKLNRMIRKKIKLSETTLKLKRANQVYEGGFVAFKELADWRWTHGFILLKEFEPIYRKSSPKFSGKKVGEVRRIRLKASLGAANFEDHEISTLLEWVTTHQPLYRSTIETVLIASCNEDIEFSFRHAVEIERLTPEQAIIKRAKYREMGGVVFSVNNGCILESVEIWALENVLYVIFAFSCYWEPEHGIEIVFLNEEIVAVGGLYDFAEVRTQKDFMLFKAKYQELRDAWPS